MCLWSGATRAIPLDGEELVIAPRTAAAGIRVSLRACTHTRTRPRLDCAFVSRCVNVTLPPALSRGVEVEIAGLALQRGMASEGGLIHVSGPSAAVHSAHLLSGIYRRATLRVCLGGRPRCCHPRPLVLAL